jgi:hypothetical protein
MHVMPNHADVALLTPKPQGLSKGAGREGRKADRDATTLDRAKLA